MPRDSDGDGLDYQYVVQRCMDRKVDLERAKTAYLDALEDVLEMREHMINDLLKEVG